MSGGISSGEAVENTSRGRRAPQIHQLASAKPSSRSFKCTRAHASGACCSSAPWPGNAGQTIPSPAPASSAFYRQPDRIGRHTNAPELPDGLDLRGHEHPRRSTAPPSKLHSSITQFHLCSRRSLQGPGVDPIFALTRRRRIGDRDHAVVVPRDHRPPRVAPARRPAARMYAIIMKAAGWHIGSPALRTTPLSGTREAVTCDSGATKQLDQ